MDWSKDKDVGSVEILILQQLESIYLQFTVTETATKSQLVSSINWSEDKDIGSVVVSIILNFTTTACIFGLRYGEN